MNLQTNFLFFEGTPDDSNSSTSNTTTFNALVEIYKNTRQLVIFPAGVFYFDTFTIPKNMHLIAPYGTTIFLKNGATLSFEKNTKIKGVTFTSDTTSSILNLSKNNEFIQCHFELFGTTYTFLQVEDSKEKRVLYTFKDCVFNQNYLQINFAKFIRCTNIHSAFNLRFFSQKEEKGTPMLLFDECDLGAVLILLTGATSVHGSYAYHALSRFLLVVKNTKLKNHTTYLFNWNPTSNAQYATDIYRPFFSIFMDNCDVKSTQSLFNTVAKVGYSINRCILSFTKNKIYSVSGTSFDLDTVNLQQVVKFMTENITNQNITAQMPADAYYVVNNSNIENNPNVTL